MVMLRSVMLMNVLASFLFLPTQCKRVRRSASNRVAMHKKEDFANKAQTADSDPLPDGAELVRTGTDAKRQAAWEAAQKAEQPKPDPACATIAASFAVAVAVPIPGPSLVPLTALGVCCPPYVKEKWQLLKDEVKNIKGKHVWQKAWGAVKGLANKTTSVAVNAKDSVENFLIEIGLEDRVMDVGAQLDNLYDREEIQEKYDSKTLSDKQKRQLEDDHEWLLYPKLVEMYRLWPIDADNDACSDRFEKKLIQMRKDAKASGAFLPGLLSGRDVIGMPETKRPLPDELSENTDSVDVKELIENAETEENPTNREKVCKSIATGLEKVGAFAGWVIDKVRVRLSQKMTLEIPEAEDLLKRFCYEPSKA